MQTRAREQKILVAILKLFPSLDLYVNILLERTSFLLRREPGLPLLPGSLFLYGVPLFGWFADFTQSPVAVRLIEKQQELAPYFGIVSNPDRGL